MRQRSGEMIAALGVCAVSEIIITLLIELGRFLSSTSFCFPHGAGKLDAVNQLLFHCLPCDGSPNWDDYESSCKILALLNFAVGALRSQTE